MATVFRRKWKEKLTDGTVKTGLCANWTIKYAYAPGKYRCITGTENKRESLNRGRDLEREARQGRLDPEHSVERELKRPFNEHLADYIVSLRTEKGRRGHQRDPMYVYNMEHRLARLAKDCDWTMLTDISVNSFCRWRDRAPACGARHKARKASGKTLNQYLESARSFCSWCVDRGRLFENPLAKAKKVMDPHVRQWRALHPDEARRLLATCDQSRRLVYLAAMTTGLRRSELAALEWQDVRIDATTTPFIQLRAEATKARRADGIAIKAELANALRAHRPADAADDDRVFASIPSMDELRGDLKAAGIEFHVPGRGYATFHSLRKTLGTMLKMAGVPKRVAMEQMRLTDERLLDWVYTDATLFNLAETVEKLPELMPVGDRMGAVAAGA